VKMAVAGGTGVVGRYVVTAAEAAGHEVVTLSRRTGSDLTTGAGLEAALAGVEVIVDATNPSSNWAMFTRSADFFTAVTGHLHLAGAKAGVKRLVTVSIVNIDRMQANPYYKAKLAQERAAKAGPLGSTILRATQFHEFPAQMILRGKFGRVVPIPTCRSRQSRPAPSARSRPRSRPPRPASRR
jgi:uncharacterized protein YbjT (DUF2867 family)